MVEFLRWLISLKRFGLYNTQINNLFNWIHGNKEKASGVSNRCAVRGMKKTASWISNAARSFLETD